MDDVSYITCSLLSSEITARTYDHAEITHLLTWCIIRACFDGSDDALSWEMCDFHMGKASCFYPMTWKKHQVSHAKITHFHTPIFSMICVLVMG